MALATSQLFFTHLWLVAAVVDDADPGRSVLANLSPGNLLSEEHAGGRVAVMGGGGREQVAVRPLGLIVMPGSVYFVLPNIFCRAVHPD